jgi:hypothetical protein
MPRTAHAATAWRISDVPPTGAQDVDIRRRSASTAKHLGTMMGGELAATLNRGSYASTVWHGLQGVSQRVSQGVYPGV